MNTAYTTKQTLHANTRQVSGITCVNRAGGGLFQWGLCISHTQILLVMYISSLGQYCGNSSASALELPQYSTKLLI